uniref:Uncharacterized protein n=1 Tax=Anguilla anguilla TaxID=7936 RepID=A0A0E9VT81_ANGAN
MDQDGEGSKNSAIAWRFIASDRPSLPAA